MLRNAFGFSLRYMLAALLFHPDAAPSRDLDVVLQRLETVLNGMPDASINNELETMRNNVQRLRAELSSSPSMGSNQGGVQMFNGGLPDLEQGNVDFPFLFDVNDLDIERFFTSLPDM